MTAYQAKRGHIPCLDGLRALSIAIVMGSHFTKWPFNPGGLGVTIFFVISGFLITRLLLAESDRKGTIDLGVFYLRRAWRLLPAILTSIVGTFAVGAALELDWWTWQRAAASLLFFQNYWDVHEPFRGPLMQHWSLAVEEHFYLIAPACLLWFGRRQWRGIVAALAAALVLALVARSYWMMVLPQASVVDYVYRATECRLDSIAFGVLLAVMAHRADTRHLVAAISKPWAAWIGFGLLAGVRVDRAADDPCRQTTACCRQGKACCRLGQ